MLALVSSARSAAYRTVRPSTAFGRQSMRADASRSSSGAAAKACRMVRDGRSRAPTGMAPSWLRYSIAPNQKSCWARRGPPAAPASCWRSKGTVVTIGDGRLRLPAVVAQEQRRGATELVGARLGDDVDDRGGRAARLGRETVGRDLELLHGLLGHVLERSTDHIVVVVGAVDHDVAAATELAGRRDEHRVRLRRIEVGRRRVAGNEQRQLEEVAAVERQHVDEA